MQDSHRACLPAMNTSDNTVLNSEVAAGAQSADNVKTNKKRQSTISDLKAIIVADIIDQEACEYFSPLASAGSLIEPEDDSAVAAKILGKLKASATTSAPQSYISTFDQVADSPVETANVPRYDKISNFISRNTRALIYAAIGLIVIASSCDFLRMYAAGKCAEANNNLNNEQYIEALASATTATKANPLSAQAYYLRGRALVKMLRYNEALECFNSALALDKDDLLALDERATVALKLKKSEITIADISRLVVLAPDDITAFQIGNRAIAYFNSGEYRKALSDYDRALKMEPSSYSLQLSRAFCLTQDLQYAEALKACTALLQMDPENNEVLTQQGYCKQQLGDKKGAMQDFNLAVKKDPGSPRWLTYRAGLLMEMNQTEKAWQDYCQAADRDLASEQAQYTAARLAGNLKHNQAALKYYDRVSHFPNFRTSFDKQVERASINIELGHHTEAATDIASALKIKRNARLLFMQALCYSHLKQDKAARETMAEANKLAGDTRALLYRAEIEAVLGDTISAIDHYSQVLKLEPNNIEALIKRGNFYLKRSQWASAGQDYKQALALGSASSEARAGWARCSQILGQGAKVSFNLPVAFNVNLAKLDNAKLTKDGFKEFQQGNNAVAALYFSELVKRDPNDLTMRRYLAHSLAGGGNHHEAINAFNALAAGARLDNKDKLTLARALAATMQYGSAIKLVEELHKAAPASDSAYAYELAKLLSASGQNEKAIAICTTTLQQSSSHGSELANLLRSLKNDDSKKNQTAEKVQLKPETEG